MNIYSARVEINKKGRVGKSGDFILESEVKQKLKNVNYK